MDERALFEAYRARASADGLIRLLEASQDRIYNLCFRVLGQTQDAEDAAQKTLLKVLDLLPTLDDANHYCRIVCKVALQCALDLYRARKARNAHEARGADMRTHVHRDSPGDNLGPLHQEIARLDDDTREILVEHYFEGKSLEEIAQMRACSRTAVWKKLEKARQSLKLALQGAGCVGLALSLESALSAGTFTPAPATLLSEAVRAKAAGVAGAASRLPVDLGPGTAFTAKNLTAALAVFLLAAGVVGSAALWRSGRAAPDSPSNASRFAHPASRNTPNPVPAPGWESPLSTFPAPATPLARPFPHVLAFREALEKVLFLIDDDARWQALRTLGIPLSDAACREALAEARGRRGRGRFAWSLFDALVGQWAQADPNGALSFTLNLKDETRDGVAGYGAQNAQLLKETMTRTILGAWMRRDATAARAFLERQIEAARRSRPEWPLPYQADLALLDALPDPAAFAARGLASNQAGLETLATAWGERDPAAALQWSQGLRRDERRWFITRLGPEWAKHDPQAALSWVRGLPDLAELPRLLENTYEAAARVRPELICALAKQDQNLSQDSIELLARARLESDPEAAADFLLELAGSGKGNPERLSRLLEAWARNDDPQEALRWLRKHAELTERPMLWSAVVAGWVGSSAADAEQALSLLPEAPSGMSPDELQRVAIAWSERDPRKAAEWALSTPGVLTASVAARVAANLCLHRQDALAWARSLPGDSDARDWALYAALDYRDSAKPFARAEDARIEVPQGIAVANEIREPGLQSAVREFVARDWAATDLKAALSWVETFPATRPLPNDGKGALEGYRSYAYSPDDALRTREELFSSLVATFVPSGAKQEQWIQQSRLSQPEKEAALRRLASQGK